MPSYVVTGASRGLGYGFIQLLASNPDNIVIGLVRDIKATEGHLKADGLSHVHVLKADITDGQSLRRAADETRKILGERGLDVLINNAAYVSDVTAAVSLKDLEQDPARLLQDTQKSFDVNVFGVYKTMHAFLPLVQQGELKKVVGISSGMGDIDFINAYDVAQAAPYALSKAAMSTLFAKFNAAYRHQGILFMTLCPGLVDTAATNTNTCAALSPSFSLPSPLTSTAVSDGDLARLQDIQTRFETAGLNTIPMKPIESAQRCLKAVDSSSLSGGYGGSFLSYNGTKEWAKKLE